MRSAQSGLTVHRSSGSPQSNCSRGWMIGLESAGGRAAINPGPDLEAVATGQEAWRWQAKITQLLISGQCQNSGKMQFELINFHFLSIAGERFSGGTTSTEKTSGEGRWAGCQRPRWVAAHQPLITPISPSISAQNLTHAHFIGGFSMRSRGLASVPMAGKLFARISRGCQPTWSLAETKQLSRAPTAIYGLKLSPRVCRVMTKDWL